MPNDSKIDSNRKHKRSPSPDALHTEEPSKRRKHRHHHHRRHRSSKHRHHSKKEELPKIDEIDNIEEIAQNCENIEEIEQNRENIEQIEHKTEGKRNLIEEVDNVEEIDQISKEERDEVESVVGINQKIEKERNLGEEVEMIEKIDQNREEKRNLDGEIGNIGEIEHNCEGKRDLGEEMGNLGVVKVASGVNSLGIDYDMEEGEIIEEEDREILVGREENGNVEALNSVGDSYRDNLHTISLDRGVDSSRRASVEEEDSYSKRQSNKDNRKIRDEATRGSRPDRLANAVYGENSSSFLESGNSNAHNDLERDLNYRSQYLYTENAQGHKKFVTRSPSYYENHTRSRSRSPSQARGRSRSQSVIRDSSLQGTPHRKGDKFYESVNGRDTDDEGNLLDNKSFRRSSREMLREKERERSSSVHTRRSDRYHARDSCEWSMLGSPDIDRERIKEKEMRNREREKAREEEAQRERHKDVEREKYRRRDKELERERDRQRERERDKERERRQRDMERSRGRSRDRHLDRDSDRSSRHRKYEGDEMDKYDQSRHRRYDESDRQDKLNKTDHDIISPLEDNEKLKRFQDEQEDYEERIVLKLAEQEDDDLDRIKEESRRRKLAILEKYRSQQSQHQEAVPAELTAKDHKERPSESVTAQNVISGTPDAQTEGPDIFTTEPSFAIGKSPQQNGLPVLERGSGTGGLGEGTPKSERSPDMFCDDIFGESPAGVRKTGKGDDKVIERSGLNDNWDDAEGYYSYRFGELLDGRYEIVAAHGKGVFSTVVRAKDLKAKPGDPEEVAIKMIRNNETMYKAGMEELVILKKLVGADPEDRRHCVRFISNFKYRNHLCLVFESLHMNLREVLKKFGRNIGLKLTAVRAYAKQLFIALKHLRNCGVLHCDIKPDNMLVNEAKNVLKLCDLGNAMFAGKNEITPYLVSRFYRAPEIILGLPYDHPLDMWSVGCCLFELYTGKVLFPGATNNDMLRLHMELKGPFPKKMLRKGAFIDLHFDHDLNFLASEEDPVTKKAIKRLMLNIKPKDVGSLILGSSGEDPKMLTNFKDLMEKIFVLDPDKRLTVSQALSHPFITGK